MFLLGPRAKAAKNAKKVWEKKRDESCSIKKFSADLASFCARSIGNRKLALVRQAHRRQAPPSAKAPEDRQGRPVRGTRSDIDMDAAGS